MIRHVALLHWKENTAADAIQAVSDAFSILATLTPELKKYQYGPDLAFYSSNVDYVLVAEFDNEHDFKSYVVNPDHTDLMKRVSVPTKASFSSPQFEL